MADLAAARLKMVDNQLRTSNVTDHRLLAAMGDIPREAFLPADRNALAYSDTIHAVGAGRFLAAPAPFARLVQLAEITHDDSVLDVGAGTGYSTAVLARLGKDVTGLEADPGLVEAARTNLSAVPNARVVQGNLDGAGLPHAAFDVIILEGAVATEPTGLFGLLREGGRLVALIAAGGPPVAHVFVKSGDEVAGRGEFNATLPPLVSAAHAETFVF